MPSSAYPTGDDLCQFLLGSGLVLPEQQDADMAAEAGRDYFESATGRLPMLAAPDTRLYDLPQITATGILDLSADLLSVTKLTVQQNELQAGNQFFLRPNDAAARGKPFNRIQFLPPYSFWGQGLVVPQHYYQAISIEGLWGYGTLIPADAFRAMLRAAALELVYGSVSAGDSGGPIPAFVKAWEAVSRTTESYDPNFLWNQKKEWQATLDRTVLRYERVGVG